MGTKYLRSLVPKPDALEALDVTDVTDVPDVLDALNVPDALIVF